MNASQLGGTSPSDESGRCGSGDAGTSRCAIRVANVSVAFQGILAVSDVDFEIASGESVAIVGPNGAGKTTMLNALSGVVGLSGKRGKIEFFGKRIERLGPAARARLGIRRSFQSAALIDSQTVLENVLLGFQDISGYSPLGQLIHPRRVSRIEKSLGESARGVLDDLGLGRVADRVVGELSFGTRKLVDIARAVACDPAVVMLDEPASGLDGSERAGLQVSLERVRRGRSTTMIFVEHHMDLVRAIADRVFAFEVGRLRLSGRPGDILDSGEFIDSITGMNVPM